MSNKDFYSVLGVDKKSTKDEIKKAYKKLARKYHPDLNKDNAEALAKYKEVTEAYEILGDDEKRKRYDNPVQNNFGGMGDFFANFEKSMQRNHYKNQLNKKVTVKLTFKEAFTGCDKTISVKYLNKCENCNATGWEKVFVCKTCRGTGVVSKSYNQSGTSVTYAINTPCQDCSGMGNKFEDKCSACNDGYLEPTTKDVTITIPKGVDTGMSMILDGLGEQSEEMSGDLIVQFIVEDHPFFERDGFNVYAKVPVSYTKLVFGGEIELPTIDGKVSVKLPERTEPGSKLKLRGEGFEFKGNKGDMIITVTCPMSKNLSEDYLSKLKELQELELSNPCEEIVSFEKMLKDSYE